MGPLFLSGIRGSNEVATRQQEGFKESSMKKGVAIYPGDGPDFP